MKMIIPLVIALVFAVTAILSPAIFLYYAPAVKNVENKTVEISGNIMFRDERWYYPLKGSVVELTNDTIPIGIAGQKYELNFGRIVKNSSITKVINLDTDNFAIVEFYTSGNISPHIVRPEKIYMEGGKEDIRITFNGTEAGDFTGTMLIRNIIPKNILAEKISRMI